MLNYSVKLDSVKDLVELKKLADRFDINGKINQNGFHGDMRSVLRNIFYRCAFLQRYLLSVNCKYHFLLFFGDLLFINR